MPEVDIDFVTKVLFNSDGSPVVTIELKVCEIFTLLAPASQFKIFAVPKILLV